MALRINHPEPDLPDDPDDLFFSPSLGRHVPVEIPYRSIPQGVRSLERLDEALRKEGLDPDEYKRPPIQGHARKNRKGILLPDAEDNGDNEADRI